MLASPCSIDLRSCRTSPQSDRSRTLCAPPVATRCRTHHSRPQLAPSSHVCASAAHTATQAPAASGCEHFLAPTSCSQAKQRSPSPPCLPAPPSIQRASVRQPSQPPPVQLHPHLGAAARERKQEQLRAAVASRVAPASMSAEERLQAARQRFAAPAGAAESQEAHAPVQFWTVEDVAASWQGQTSPATHTCASAAPRRDDWGVRNGAAVRSGSWGHVENKVQAGGSLRQTFAASKQSSKETRNQQAVGNAAKVSDGPRSRASEDAKCDAHVSRHVSRQQFRQALADAAQLAEQVL